MFLLPKGNPLAENVPIAKLQLPEALDKLKNGKLTGCATFSFPTADCTLLYDEGKLVHAVVHRDGIELKDRNALQALVELMLLAGDGRFNVYGHSREIMLAVLGLLNGETQISRQEIKQIDFKALLERIKTDQLTGTLSINADGRCGLILYKGGTTVGFFHDTSTSIETSAGEVQQIAALPGANAELRTLSNPDDLRLDLAGLVDIRKLWEAASGNIFSATPSPVATTASPVTTVMQQPTVSSPADIETVIIELVNQHVGKLGKTLAEKELMNIGGISALKNPESYGQFIAALEKGSRLLASANKIKEMNDAISREIAKL